MAMPTFFLGAMVVTHLLVSVPTPPSIVSDPSTQSCDDFNARVATTPIPQQQGNWLALHERQLAELPERADVIILGDSQAARFPQSMAASAFPGQSVLNLGVGADRTQMTTWRLQDEAFLKLDPSLVLLLAGGPNLALSDGCAVAAGVLALIDQVHNVWPQAHIVKVDITPRGENFLLNDTTRRYANQLVADALSGVENVSTINADDTLTCGMYPQKVPILFWMDLLNFSYRCPNYQSDMLHWTSNGYAVIVDAVLDKVDFLEHG